MLVVAAPAETGEPVAGRNALQSPEVDSRRFLAEAVLAQALGDRIVLQDICPLADSIEWELGQRYWEERGARAFLGDTRPVPYIVNNDSTLSRNAAELCFASLGAAEKTGP